MPTGPRPGRRPVDVRMSYAALDALNQLARDENVLTEKGQPNRSEMIRILLAYAMRTWKRGWRPNL